MGYFGKKSCRSTLSPLSNAENRNPVALLVLEISSFKVSSICKLLVSSVVHISIYHTPNGQNCNKSFSSDDPIKHPKSSTKNYHGKTLFWLKLGCLGQF
jgi:hypothetical protein